MAQGIFNALLADGIAQELGEIPLVASQGLFDIKINDAVSAAESMRLQTNNYTIPEAVFIIDQVIRAVPFVRTTAETAVVADLTLAEKNLISVIANFEHLVILVNEC